jgi:nuclear transport factor 2 (NTF2) superfamily protein
MLESHQLRPFAESYTAAWCSRNPASVASFFSPNGSLSVNDAAPAVGREAITRVAQSFMTAFPDLRVLMDELVIEGERAFYRWTLIGTNDAPGGTGQQVRVSGVEEWTIGTDGLILQSRGRFDAEEYERQLQHGYS